MSESKSWTDDAAGRARDAVDETAHRAGEKAREVGSTVHERVRDQVDERSTAAGTQADQVGHAMRDASEQLRSQGNDLPARAAEEVANRAEQLARYLRETDGGRIMGDIERFGRRQPLLVAAVGLAAGVAAARLLKASANRSGDSAPTGRGSTRVDAGPMEPDTLEGRYPASPPAGYGAPGRTTPAPAVPPVRTR